MATYVQLERVAAGIVPEAHDQIKWALTLAADAVESEDPQTANHNARIKWAYNWRAGKVRTSFYRYMQILLQVPGAAAGIAGTDEAPTVTWTDAAVQTVIDGQIDNFASLP